MFRRKTLFVLLIWCALVLSFLFLFRTPSETDRQAYQRLLFNQENRAVACQAKQRRMNVTKHFLFTQGSDRLGLKLRSFLSDLTLAQEGDKTELVEHFKDLHCTMQEALLQHPSSTDPSTLIPRQRIRQLDAERATYQYKTEDLEAEQIKLTRYLAEGHQLDDSLKPVIPLMNGAADQIQFSLSDRDQPIKAQGMQATFYNLGAEL